MELEKMSVDELLKFCESASSMNGTLDRYMWSFDELARRLALKDADLLLEREKAEKAESQRDAIASLAAYCCQCGGSTKGKQICLACAGEEGAANAEIIKRLERELAEVLKVETPDSTLPPLGGGPRKTLIVEVEVPENWEQRLDMQWVLEREINADRWKWNWSEAIGDREGAALRLANTYEDRAEKAEAQVKMLVEALTELCSLKTYKDSFGKTQDYLKYQPAAWKQAEEALAKIKEEKHKCACCGVACGERYPAEGATDTEIVFLCCECAA